MSRYVAFLRAINVGGSHVVKMDALREIFEGLGFAKVETFIASGNVIFETRSKDPKAVERKIEGALAGALGYEVATFIRSFEEVGAITRHPSFPPRTLASAIALNVGLLKEPLSAAARAALPSLRTSVDDFHAHGSELYWICLTRQSESKVSNAVFERVLKLNATFRGMRTLEKLLAKYGSD
jgi:uncharacterized protein (DUF1697 family)